MKKLVETIDELRKELANVRQKRQSNEKFGSISLVPTMGALHKGHLALVKASHQKRPDAFVVVSIFVNPRQFAADGVDLEKYPKKLEKDLELLKGKADLVFAPSVEEIYPPFFGNEIKVTAGTNSAAKFEGSNRPGHFDGVLTVVSKLFNIVQPDFAFFGQKDAEQVFLIKQMTQQLNFPIEICVVETVREPDGLALSSRNQHLNSREREISLRLSKALFEAKKMIENGEQLGKCKDSARKILQDVNEKFKLDYFVVVEWESLKEIEEDVKFRGKAMILVACLVGQTRLIDNVFVDFE